MRKFVFFVLGIVIGGYCFGANTSRVESRLTHEGWVVCKSSPTVNSVLISAGTKAEGWKTYYSGSPAYFTWATPERATSFIMSDFPEVQYPFWIKKLKNIFYEHPNHPWDTDQFKFKIYAGDGSTLLKESGSLTALKYPSETVWDMGADSVQITSGDFYVSVVPGASGYPSCIADGTSDGKSYYGSPGNWTAFTDGEFARYAYLAWTAVAHDVGVTSIDVPGGIWVDTAYTVKATVKNMGLNTESFDVGCIITYDATPVFTDTVSVTNLAPGATQQISFTPDWTPDIYDEQYTIRCGTYLAGDLVPGNDTLSKVCQTYEQGEIAYDDFVAESYWVVDDPNGPTDAFAVQLTPYIAPPFNVTKGKVYVNDTTAFEYIGLFPESGGFPNMSAPYQTIANPSAVAAPGWIVVDFDTTLTHMETSANLWLVAKFMPGSSGPGIGGDENAPIDGKSYWSQDFSTWNSTTGLPNPCDFLMRIVHAPAAGVEEGLKVPKFALDYSSNPIRGDGSIVYELPAKMNVSIKLYDITGRVVSTLVDGVMSEGKHELSLNTRELVSGIYFCKFDAGEFSKTKKLILLK